MKEKECIIFVDMDGVIVDFNKTWKYFFRFDLMKYFNRYNKIKKLNGWNDSNITVSFNREFWSKMQTKQNFFKHAEPMKGFSLLKFYLNKQSNPFMILTSVPSKTYVDEGYIEIVKAGKNKWRDLNFPGVDVKFVSLCEDKNGAAVNKHKQIIDGVKCILIDDQIDNIIEWEANGGVGIHHKGSMIMTIFRLWRATH